MNNQKQKICMKCGVPITSGSAFCTACGAPVPADERKICMKCGVPIAPGSAFCTACGAPAPGADAPATPQANLSPEELNKRSYENALKLVEAKQYDAALQLFTKLGDYEDSKKKAEECKAAAEEARKEALYTSAVALLSNKKATDVQLKQAISNLKGMPDYKDSKNQVAKLEKCLNDLNAAKKKKKAKTIKIVIIAAVAFVLLVASAIALIVLNIPYTIQIDKDGSGYFEEIDYNMLTDDIVLEHVEIPGYEFIGWSGSDLDDLTKDVVIKKFSNGNRTYQANYTPKKYTVTLNPDGGECVEATHEMVYNRAYILPTPTKVGYNFEGWYNGDTLVSNDSVWTSLSDMTLTAKWSVKTYDFVLENAYTKSFTVYFYYNYGSYAETAYEHKTLTTGSKLNCPASHPTRTGYLFTGWYVDKDCTTRYTFEGDITSDMILYAGWMAMPQSLAFTQEQIPPTYYTGSKDYYSLNLSGTYTTSKNLYFVTLNKGTHTVYYSNSNGNSLYGYNLTIKNLTTGVVIQTVEDISNTSFEALTFESSVGDVIEMAVSRVDTQYSTYAQFYFDGFEVESTAVATSNDFVFSSGSSYRQEIEYGAEFTLPEISRPGYEFLGWYYNDTKVEGGTWTYTEDVLFKAKWNAKGNIITLAPEGGSVSSTTINVKYNEKFELPVPTKPGYSFSGWYDEDGRYWSATEHTWTYFEDMKLTAKWVAKTYRVNLEDVSTSSYATVTLKNNYSDAYYENFNIVSVRLAYTLYTSSVPTRSGYIFTGWYTDAECTKPFDLATPITEDIDLYAGWTKLALNNSYSSVTQLNPDYYGTSGYSYSINTSGTSVSAWKRVAVTATETGTHAVYYRNGTSGNNYGYYIEIYNATDNKIICEKKLVTSTSWAHYDFTAEAGDVIVVSVYRYNSNYSSNAYMYFSGFMLDSRLKGDPVYGYSDGAKVTLDSSVYFGDEVKLPTPVRTGYKFLGWYYNDTKVESGKWSLDAESTTVNLTPKWEEIK